MSNTTNGNQSVDEFAVTDNQVLIKLFSNFAEYR